MQILKLLLLSLSLSLSLSLFGRETLMTRKKDQKHPGINHPQPDNNKWLHIPQQKTPSHRFVGCIVQIQGNWLQHPAERQTRPKAMQLTDCSKLNPCLPSLSDGCLWWLWGSTQHSALCSESIHHSHRVKNFVSLNWAAPTQLREPLIPMACNPLNLQCLQGKATVSYLPRMTPPSTTTPFFLWNNTQSITEQACYFHLHDAHFSSNSLSDNLTITQPLNLIILTTTPLVSAHLTLFTCT